ncbi:MAG: MFS transporter, partial [Deltaproteobacteria bacterium]|nr:MFS transporter [Deltaproteobacteria bacterium]
LIISTCYSIPFFLLPFYLQNILSLSPSFIGLLFMVPPIMTVVLAPMSGTLADRFGPRLPASFGILFLTSSLLLGYFFEPRSHWILPASMIALGAITNGLFNPANSKAMISMMPREHRGFATAVNHVFFSMGNVLGVAIGGFLMTAAFEAHTGIPGINLTTEQPVGFVAALNTTFLAAVGLSLLGLVTSLARGSRTS